MVVTVNVVVTSGGLQNYVLWFLVISNFFVTPDVFLFGRDLRKMAGKDQSRNPPHRVLGTFWISIPTQHIHSRYGRSLVCTLGY